ncbi:DoxX family protein [Paenibacillus caseinilyticus]|uniref:Membrane protein n=1 Tax=Paenibacillus mucilaginosus K02 TaxID=997761 RepID=I0BJZ1_9BACL|nr:DoxX family protein [Paenibacillus mucilaginosus]AFH62688.1 membrane protein [Paenibacillus mucilaginosus K02]
MVLKIEMKTNMGITIANDISKARLWTARAMSGIVVLFMLFDGIGKIAKPAPVVEGTLALGFTENHLATMGVLGLLCTILYALPRTRFLGALLLTGYLGGAVAAHLRVDNPLWSHMMFPVYIAIFAWGALWLIDRRLRTLLWERE